jgi:hypothetical protein
MNPSHNSLIAVAYRTLPGAYESYPGLRKIKEMLMDSFIDSKNNLDLFAKDVTEISQMIQKGIDDYNDAKKATSEALDGNSA